MKYLFIFIYLLFLFNLQAQVIWEEQDSGTTQNLNSVDFINADMGIIVGDSGTILRTEDGGETWLQCESGTTQNLYSISFFNETEAVAVGAAATIIRTEDSGSNWTAINVDGLYYDMFSVYLHPEGGGIAGGDSQTILNTHDGGLTWSIIQTDYWGGGFWGAHMVDNDIGFLVGENSIMAPLLAYTANGGDYFGFEYFYLVDGMVAHEGRALSCHFFSALEGIIVSRRWDGWGCVTSAELPGFSTDHYLNSYNSIDFVDDDYGMIAGDNGQLLVTDDGGENWDSVETIYADFRDVDLPLDHILAYLVGGQGTIVKRYSDVSAFGTDLPKNELKLWNQPNPIIASSRNSGTRILFDLPEAGAIELAIYNLKGSLIQLLTEGYYSAGEHEAYWNSDEVAAGIYVCLLKQGSEKQAHKIIKLSSD